MKFTNVTELERVIEDCHFNSDKFDALCKYLTENGTLKRTITVEEDEYGKITKVFILGNNVITVELEMNEFSCWINVDID